MSTFASTLLKLAEPRATISSRHPRLYFAPSPDLSTEVAMAHRDIILVVAEVLARTPNSVRRDISAKDAGSRARAEETLAAMIAAAIGEQDGNGSPR